MDGSLEQIPHDGEANMDGIMGHDRLWGISRDDMIFTHDDADWLEGESGSDALGNLSSQVGHGCRRKAEIG